MGTPLTVGQPVLVDSADGRRAAYEGTVTAVTPHVVHVATDRYPDGVPFSPTSVHARKVAAL